MLDELAMTRRSFVDIRREHRFPDAIRAVVSVRSKIERISGRVVDVRGTNAGCRNLTGEQKVAGAFLASCMYGDFTTEVSSSAVFSRKLKAGICADRRHLLRYSMLVKPGLPHEERITLRMR